MKSVIVKVMGILVVSVAISQVPISPEDARSYCLSTCVAITALMSSLTCAAVVYLMGQMSRISQDLYTSIKFNSILLGVQNTDAVIRRGVATRIGAATKQFIENCILSFICVLLGVLVPYVLLSDPLVEQFDEAWIFPAKGAATGFSTLTVFVCFWALHDSFAALKSLIKVDEVKLMMK